MTQKGQLQSCKLGEQQAPHGSEHTNDDVGVVRCDNGTWRAAASPEKSAPAGDAPTGKGEVPMQTWCEYDGEKYNPGTPICNKELGQMMVCKNGKWDIQDEAC